MMPSGKPRAARLMYALVAQEEDVLVDYSDLSGNFPTVARTLLLPRLQSPSAASSPASSGTRVSYMYDAHAFHCIFVHGVTFVCMSDEHYSLELAFEFMRRVSAEFVRTYASASRSARHSAGGSTSSSRGSDGGDGGKYGSLSLLDDGRGGLVVPVSTFASVSYAGFRPTLKRLMKEHNALARAQPRSLADSTEPARQPHSHGERLGNEAADPAVENIEKLLLGNGEKIDLVVDLSDNESPSPLMRLRHNQGHNGGVGSRGDGGRRRRVRRRCVYLCKTFAFFLAVVLAIGAVAYTLACGGPYFQKCHAGLVRLDGASGAASQPPK